MIVRSAISGLLVLVGAQSAASAADHRDVLLAALDLRDDALIAVGREPPTASPLRNALLNAAPEFLSAIAPHLPPVAELQARLARANAKLAASAAIPASAQAAMIGDKAIDYPEPDPISDCIDASASATQALIEAWSASTEVLAAAKWACLQTELTVNFATACTGIAVETELIEGDLDRQSFCLGAQRDAVLAAFSQTQSSVVDFINERADVTVVSRATQTSVDALRATLDSTLLRLTELSAAQIEDDAATVAGLDEILGEALALAAQLTALSADIADVRFRIQAAQVDVEDVQQRLADLQAIALRLAQSGAALRSRMQSIHARVTDARSLLHRADDQQLDRRLAAAMGDADVLVLRYRLPAAVGGELERSRELLIRTLGQYQALGADTSAARALLVSGDDAYNQGQALDAWDAFASAYRLLLDTQPSLSVLIMRNSFE